MRSPHCKKKMPKLWFYALLILVVGCATSERPKQHSVSAGPAASFSALEDRLLNATTIRFDFHVTAEGAFNADLHGALNIGPENRVRLTASGQFGGQPVDVLLRSGEGEFEYGNNTNRIVADRPTDLNEAVLIGLTRMGILHNLARLTSARPPDHAEGGVRDWVSVGSFAAGSGDSDTLSFDLTVAGRAAGSASLKMDSRGHPIVRHQTVQFPSGEMQVIERYSAVTIDP